MPPAQGQMLPHLFTEASFQVQGLVGHEELPGGLRTRLGSWLLRSILHLTDQQTCRVPGKQQRTTRQCDRWHPVLGRDRSSAFPCAHTPEVTDKGVQSWTNNQGASVDNPSLLMQSWRETDPVTSYELSLPHFLLRKLSPQSPPHKSAREREDSCEIRIRTSADVSESFCTSETGRLLPAANYPGLPPLSQTSLITVLAYPPVLQCFW